MGNPVARTLGLDPEDDKVLVKQTLKALRRTEARDSSSRKMHKFCRGCSTSAECRFRN